MSSEFSQVLRLVNVINPVHLHLILKIVQEPGWLHSGIEAKPFLQVSHHLSYFFPVVLFLGDTVSSYNDCLYDIIRVTIVACSQFYTGELKTRISCELLDREVGHG